MAGMLVAGLIGLLIWDLAHPHLRQLMPEIDGTSVQIVSSQ
jgi:hypothetical protein